MDHIMVKALLSLGMELRDVRAVAGASAEFIPETDGLVLKGWYKDTQKGWTIKLYLCWTGLGKATRQVWVIMKTVDAPFGVWEDKVVNNGEAIDNLVYVLLEERIHTKLFI